MDLKEYLKEKLEIGDPEAEKIKEVVEEYKQKHGHHHAHHESKETQDIFSMICEDKETCMENHYQLSAIHCNGCRNCCSLENPQCGRGSMLQQEFKNLAR